MIRNKDPNQRLTSHWLRVHPKLRRCLGRLQANGFVVKSGKTYAASEAGRELVDRCRIGRKTVFGVLTALSVELPDGGQDPKDPYVTEEAVRDGYKKYQKTFDRLLAKIEREEAQSGRSGD